MDFIYIISFLIITLLSWGFFSLMNYIKRKKDEQRDKELEVFTPEIEELMEETNYTPVDISDVDLEKKKIDMSKIDPKLAAILAIGVLGIIFFKKRK